MCHFNCNFGIQSDLFSWSIVFLARLSILGNFFFFFESWKSLLHESVHCLGEEQQLPWSILAFFMKCWEFCVAPEGMVSFSFSQSVLSNAGEAETGFP